jgi:hypothetical protein
MAAAQAELAETLCLAGPELLPLWIGDHDRRAGSVDKAAEPLLPYRFEQAAGGLVVP